MKNVFKIAVSLMLAGLLTACGTGATATPPPAQATQPAAALPTVSASDPCTNEYFAVKANATLDYSSTGGPTGPYSFSNIIAAVQPGGFSMKVRYSKNPRKLDWACKPEGLSPQSFPSFDFTGFIIVDRFSKIEVTNITGSVLPATLTPGATWNFAYDITGIQVKNGATTGNMGGHVSTAYTVKNKESVTVGAGTFDAMAVEAVTTLELDVQSQKGPSKVKLSSTYTQWYAPGVGLVKAVGSGTLNGSEYFESVVLDSYTIP